MSLDAAYGVHELHEKVERLEAENAMLRTELGWALSARNSPLNRSNEVPHFERQSRLSRVWDRLAFWRSLSR